MYQCQPNSLTRLTTPRRHIAPSMACCVGADWPSLTRPRVLIARAAWLPAAAAMTELTYRPGIRSSWPGRLLTIHCSPWFPSGRSILCKSSQAIPHPSEKLLLLLKKQLLLVDKCSRLALLLTRGSPSCACHVRNLYTNYHVENLS